MKINNPVNAAPGGPNPHAWIGDISDLLDSMRENMPARDQPNYSEESYRALTELAYDLEQESHYADARGAVMFAGEFPNKLLRTFESCANDSSGKRPKNVPKVRMFACSRELEYGLSHLFGWEQAIRLSNQPVGRVLAGSTIVWELWHNDGEYAVETLMYQPGMKGMLQLQKRTSLKEYRNQYLIAINETGSWQDICKDKTITSQVLKEVHSSMFWFVLFSLVAVGLLLAYRRGFRRGEYEQLR